MWLSWRPLLPKISGSSFEKGNFWSSVIYTLSMSLRWGPIFSTVLKFEVIQKEVIERQNFFLLIIGAHLVIFSFSMGEFKELWSLIPPLKAPQKSTKSFIAQLQKLITY